VSLNFRDLSQCGPMCVSSSLVHVRCGLSERYLSGLTD